METKSFRVAGLSSCPHTPETREAFRQYVNGSVTEFVTKAIVEYAKELGFFMAFANDYQPEYIGNKRFAEIQIFFDKSRRTDYTYLVAFEYLRSQRPGVSKSNITRDAIKNF